MRRIIRFSAVITLLTLIMSGCTEIVEEKLPEIGGVRRIVLSAQSDPTVKSAIGDGSSVVFVQSDSLRVFEESNPSAQNAFTIPEGNLHEDGSADFVGTLTGEEGRLFAVYPYRKSDSLVVQPLGVNPYAVIFTEVPAVQTAVSGSFDPAAHTAAAMVESGESGYSMTLRNPGSMIKFSIPEGLTGSKVVFRSNRVVDLLAGKVILSIYLNNPSEVLMSYAPNSTGLHPCSVELHGEIRGGEYYYIETQPATLAAGFGIDVYDSTGAVICSRSTDKSVELAPNHILNLQTIPAVTSTEWEGQGTEASPYLIKSFADLKLLEQRMSTVSGASTYGTKVYKQTTDIDCGGQSVVIGGVKGSWNDDLERLFFKGIYMGNNHVISNYVMPPVRSNVDESDFLYENQYCYGLFNQVKDAQIFNLDVAPAPQLATPATRNYAAIYVAGALVGRAESSKGKSVTISGCNNVADSFEADVSKQKTSTIYDTQIYCHIGGLVGQAFDCNLRIIGCTNNSDITVSGSEMSSTHDHWDVESVGGLIGCVFGDDFDSFCEIYNCRNTGDIYGNSTESSYMGVGGLVGSVTETVDTHDRTLRVWNCVNEGNVRANNTDESNDNRLNHYITTYAGGIIGMHRSDGDSDVGLPRIYNCLNKGDIRTHFNQASAGGICGMCYDDETTIAVCVNVGKISGDAPGDHEAAKRGAISGCGEYGVFTTDGATCVACYWTDSVLPCAYDGSPSNCQCLSTITASMLYDTINNKYDSVLKGKTAWDKERWAEASQLWTGGWGQGTANDLDLKLN